MTRGLYVPTIKNRRLSESDGQLSPKEATKSQDGNYPRLGKRYHKKESKPSSSPTTRLSTNTNDQFTNFINGHRSNKARNKYSNETYIGKFTTKTATAQVIRPSTPTDFLESLAISCRKCHILPYTRFCNVTEFSLCYQNNRQSFACPQSVKRLHYQFRRFCINS